MEYIAQSETRRYNRLISEIDEVYHRIAVRIGFSDSAMSILYTLADHDGRCRLPELIRLSGINKQTVNSALRKLEKDGLICLEPAGGRSKQVRLTEKGLAIADKTVKKVLDAERRIYSSWPREEWELYVKLTERYVCGLRKELKEIFYEDPAFGSFQLQ